MTIIAALIAFVLIGGAVVITGALILWVVDATLSDKWFRNVKDKDIED